MFNCFICATVDFSTCNASLAYMTDVSSHFAKFQRKADGSYASTLGGTEKLYKLVLPPIRDLVPMQWLLLPWKLCM